MADQTIWKLDLQAGNSDAILKSFENSLNVAKDKINQVVAAGENFSKLDSFQQKAAEAAKKLEVAQASAALALKKAQDAASGGKASAEQLALMQAKAGQAAQKVTGQETALGAAMAKVQLETERLQTAMAEESVKCESLGKIFTFLKETATSAASGMSAGFESLKGVVAGVSEQVTSFASNMRSNMESARTEIVETEVASNEASSGITSGFHGASGGLLDFAGKAGMAVMGLQGIVQIAMQVGSALLGPIASAEQLGISFTTLMGSSKKAAEEIKELNHFADVTPFEPEPVQQYAAQLIGMGTAAKDVIPELTSVGDALFGIGHGSEAEMKSVVDILGKIKVAGVMTWGDISQMQTHGIDVLDAMSRATGKTKEALRAMSSNGTLPAKYAIDALTKGIEMNPLYQGGMAKQSASLSGVLSTLSGYLKEGLDGFLGIKDGMVVTGSIVDRVKGLFQGLATAVSSPAFQNFVSGAGEKIGGVLGWIGDRLSNAVSPPLKFVTDQFQSPAFQNFAGSIGSKISNIFGRIGAVISNDFGPPLKKVVDYLSSGFSSFATDVGKRIADAFSTIGTFLQSKVEPPLKAIMGYLESDAFKKFASGVGQRIIDVFAGMGKFLETKVNPPLIAFGNYVQNTIVPTLQQWGHNIQIWVIDKFNDLKSFIETKIMPKLIEFWGYIQTYIVPVLIGWGKNIKTWVIDKFDDLKTYIEKQVIPKLIEFWGWIQTYIIPVLVSWGTNIKTWVIDKLSDLKIFIEKQVMPKLIEFWGWIQNNIVSAFSNWGDKVKTVQDNLTSFKDFIEKQVIPALLKLWTWIATTIGPVFQSLGNIITTDVLPHTDDFKTSIGHLTDSLGRLWEKISGPVLLVLGLLGLSAGVETKGKFDGLKTAIDFVGVGINAFLKGVNDAINTLSVLIDWLATAIGWLNQFEAGITNAAANIISFLSGGKVQAYHIDPNTGQSKALGKPGTVGSFASGIENFGGGLAYVHANEMLVNLPKGMSVWNPAKTAAFMQGLKMPTPTFAMSSQSQSSGSSQSGANDQVVGLLAAILDALQKQGRGNVTMNANVASGSVDAQRINQTIQSLGGKAAEMMQRGAW